MVEKSKPCEIYKKMCNVYGEPCFSKKKKKKFTNEPNKWVNHYKPMEWKHTDFLEKKKFQGQQSVKKVTLMVLWNMKRLITIDSLEKEATVNNASYYQPLR